MGRREEQGAAAVSTDRKGIRSQSVSQSAEPRVGEWLSAFFKKAARALVWVAGAGVAAFRAVQAVTSDLLVVVGPRRALREAHLVRRCK